MFEEGYTHDFFNVDKTTEEITYYDPNFYITPNVISVANDEVKQLVSSAIKNEVPLVFIARSFSDQFIRFIQTQQAYYDTAKFVCIKLPSFGEEINMYVEDLYAYLSEDLMADKITVSPYETVIFSSEHNGLDKRLDTLKTRSQNTYDKIESNRYMKHYYKLSNNVATIFAGGITPEAIREEYDRIEDAIGAVSTAIKEGYSIGAGKAMYNFDPEHNIFSRPYYTILNNANIKPNDLKENEGYNVKTGAIVDLEKEGIIDPTNTLVTALKGALTNTKLVLNTKYILYNE
jgi:chaperonin GroEL (HSP60 family)